MDNKPIGFLGIWSQVHALGNDYWDGPAYWKNTDGSIKIKFTTDDRYFRRASTGMPYAYIGTFKQLPNNQVEITPTNPTNPPYPTYILDYDFEPGGLMTWGKFWHGRNH